MHRFLRHGAAVLFFLLALQATGCGAAQPGGPRGARDASSESDSEIPDPSKCFLAVGQKVAPTTAARFGREGQSVTFPSGDVTVLAFLSSWNRYLDKALPHLQRLHDTYRSRGISVIDIDNERDFDQKLPEFWRTHPVSFPIVWDAEGAIYTRLRASPVTVAVLDRGGVVRYVASGDTATEDIDAAALDRAVRDLLAAPASTIPSYVPPACETTLGQKLAARTYPRLDAPARTIAIPTGKWTLLAFVASWNAPAMHALGELQRISDDYAARGLTVIAIAVDDEQSGVMDAVRRGGAAFPVVFDEGKRIAARLQPSSMPTFVLLDERGIVRYIARGYHGDLRADFAKSTQPLL
jgi:thiol-disulfide isomerase/thioredoxin